MEKEDLYCVYGYRVDKFGHEYEERIGTGLTLADAEKLEMEVAHAWTDTAIVSANDDIGWWFIPPKQPKQYLY